MSISVSNKIDEFLKAPAFGVVGASDNPSKYGNKVYKCYLSNNRKAYPVNPNCEKIDGNQVYPNLDALPEKVVAISVITPPAVTEKVVDDAITYGIRHIWMQPGAESAAAVQKAEQAGISVIYGGPCLLVELGW